MGVRNILLYILVLSPLAYSFDNDPYRSYEVLGVASFSAGLLLLNRLRGFRVGADMWLLAVYGLIIIFQQLFIENGAVEFGARYAIVIMAMLLPPLTAIAVFMHTKCMTKVVVWTTNTLCAIAVGTIYSSFFFGFGETYTGDGLLRAFGWLGDSFTPVLVFLILYFVLQKRWLQSVALLGALIMTGGKAGMMMLVAAPVMYVLISPATKRKKIGIFAAGVVTAIAVSFLWVPISAALFQNYEYSYNNRIISMQLGVQYFQESPWVGIGVNQSMKFIGVESETIINSESINAFPVEQINNAFVRTLAETGILGLCCFLALCAVWLLRGVRGLSKAYQWHVCPERSITIAGGFWVIGFVLFYQTTGWFEAGHPQLAWLLMISAIAEAVYTRATAEQSAVASAGQPVLPIRRVVHSRVANSL